MAGKKKSGGSVDFKVTASGLNKVEKDAKKAGKSFNQLDKNASSADRAGKGVAQMSSNVTKNFSKMSQGITGGLVPAYATLAAQLFAIDALFRFLKDAADFRVLMEGQEAFAATTGRAMKTIAREIQAATAAQITFKEASQAAAIGLAAGLSPGQLKELGESAKIVSIALGRDVTDSFNRLVRGVTKAEPELLDELGIILRLEEASIRYASALGLNKNQLTTFQKSQAVANEVLRQSEERYGAIAEMLGDDSVNQLNKLSVAFDEVLNNFRNFIGPIAEFFGGFLVENIESATAALGVFAATISGGLIRQAIPNIDTRGMSNQIQQNLGGVIVPGAEGSAMENRRQRVLSGQGTEADVAQYQKALKSKTTSLLTFESVSRSEATRTFNLLKLQRQQMVVESTTGFARMRAQFVMELYTMQATHGKVMGTMKMGFVALGKVANGIMRLAGFIGIAVMLVQMGKSLYERFKGVDKTIEELEEKTKSYTETQKGLNDELERTAKVFDKDMFSTRSQEIEAIGNAFQSADLQNRITDYNAMFEALGGDNEEVVAFRAELSKTFDTLTKFDPRFAKFNKQLETNPILLNSSVGAMRKYSAENVLSGQAVKSLQEATANASKQINQFAQALPKVPYQNVIISQEQMVLSLQQLIKAQGNTTEETENYQKQLDITLGKMEAFKFLAMANVEIMQMMYLAQQKVASTTNSVFGEKKDADAAYKTAGALKKMFEAQAAVFQAEQNITDNLGAEEKKIREAQLKNAKLMEDTALDTLAATVLMEKTLFRINKMAMKGLTEELGKSLGKALRGEKDAFKDFGKNLAKQLTDEMGKQVAENIMKITYGGTPLDPRFQQQVFKQQLKDSFKEGFTDKGSPFQRGATGAANQIGEAMHKAANHHINGLYNAKVALAEAKVAAAEQARDGQGKVVSGYKQTIEKYGKDGTVITTQDDNTAQMREIRQQIKDEQEKIRAANVAAHASGDPYGKASGVEKFLNKYTTPSGIAGALGKETPGMKKQSAALFKKSPIIQGLEDELTQVQRNFLSLGDEIQDNSQKLSIANQEIEGATLTFKELDKSVEGAKEELKKIEAGAPNPAGFVPEDPNIPNSGGTGGNDGTSTPSVGGVDPDYFSKKAEELFPNIMSTIGENEFGQNVMQFGTAITQFATLTAQGFALAGKQEEAANIMLEVAKIQMALAMAEMALQLSTMFKTPARYGGIMSPSGKSFSGGGIAAGPEAGYNATLHGTEAVVPLGNDRSIPVKMSGTGGTNNVNVTVNVDQNGASESIMTGDGARELGKTIAAIAQDTIAKEQRAGGLLSTI
jgi:hypothetical protein